MRNDSLQRKRICAIVEAIQKWLGVRGSVGTTPGELTDTAEVIRVQTTNRHIVVRRCGIILGAVTPVVRQRQSDALGSSGATQAPPLPSSPSLPSIGKGKRKLQRQHHSRQQTADEGNSARPREWSAVEPERLTPIEEPGGSKTRNDACARFLFRGNIWQTIDRSQQ
jgi:hypothetical protein